MPTLVECHLTSTKIVHNFRQRIPFEESNPLKDDLLTSGMIIENYIFGGRQPKKGSLRLSFEDLEREQNLKDIRRSQQREIELHILLKKELKMEREKHQLRLCIRSISCSIDVLAVKKMVFQDTVREIANDDRQSIPGSLRLSKVCDVQKYSLVDLDSAQFLSIYNHTALLMEQYFQFADYPGYLKNRNKQRNETERQRRLKVEEIGRQRRLKVDEIGRQRRLKVEREKKLREIKLEDIEWQRGLTMEDFECERRLNVEEIERQRRLKVEREKKLVKILFGITAGQFAKFQDGLLESKKIDNLVQQQQNKRGTSKAENRVRSENDRLMCKICYIYQLNVLFLPCSHVVACNRCAAKLKTCAVCRADIKEALPAYFN